MQKRPERLKLLDHNYNHNNSRELRLESLEHKNETKSIISDNNSQISHLFPHVTRRKKDEESIKIDAYNNIETSNINDNKSIKGLSQMTKKQANANLNFVFQ